MSNNDAHLRAIGKDVDKLKNPYREMYNNIFGNFNYTTNATGWLTNNSAADLTIQWDEVQRRYVWRRAL